MDTFRLESQIDWLTLTLKPEAVSVSLDDCFQVLTEQMLLGDLIGKMVPSGRFSFYDYTLGYENIFLSYTKPERVKEQGICLRFSSQGLDYFNRYLKSYNIDLKQWLGMWRGLCFDGFISKVTRFDFALDDIHFNGHKPLLTMPKLLNCLRKREVRKKAHVLDIYDGNTSLKERYATVDGEPVVGRTLYIGSRQSDVCCRFYDKLAEQLQKKQSVDEGVTSWVRCEFEFKGSAAMGVLNAFIDSSDEGFAGYMRGVINNYVAFISRTKSNISRCPVKRWWSKFICGCTYKFRLPHKEPARSSLAKAENGLRKYVRTVYTMFQVWGLDGVYMWFENEVRKIVENSTAYDTLYKADLANNIAEDFRDYEEMNGLKYYKYNSYDGDEGFCIEDNIYLQRDDYFRARFKALQDPTLHDLFMDGQEVLTC